MKNLNDWNFSGEHVQNDVKSSGLVNSKTTIIAFGPPKFDMIATGKIDPGLNEVNPNVIEGTDIGDVQASQFAPIPVGMVQSYNLGQQRQIERLMEIGSERSLIVPGRTIPNFGMDKVLYSGPSLLKFASSYYLNRTTNNILDTVNLSKIQDNINDLNLVAEDVGGQGKNRAGYGNLFLNLASNLFSHPVGVLLWFKTVAGENYGAVYLEECHISTHQMSMSSGQSMVGESCSFEFDRIVPVDVGYRPRE